MPARRRHRTPKPQAVTQAAAPAPDLAPTPATAQEDPDLTRRIKKALRSRPDAAARTERLLGR